MHTHHLRFEHLGEALGTHRTTPRLSWHTSTDQVAYEIAVDGGLQPYTTGRIDDTDSSLRPWPAPPLTSRQRRHVRVRAWSADRPDPSEWSTPAVIETGLLHPHDWQATAISPHPDAAGPLPRPAMLLRRDFTATAPVTAARLYATAHGLYEMEINGRRAGDHVLAPGWTSYPDRLRYQTFDVTDLLHDGANTIGAWLADGWYRGLVGFNGGTRDHYGTRTALLAQLELHHPDGTTTVVATDRNWRSTTSPITATGLYEGERHDARNEHRGWSSPGFDDRTWAGVTEQELDLTRLTAPVGPPVRRIQTLNPVAELTSPSGRRIIDFGQNISGRLRIRVRGNAGQVIRLRHAEVLEHGELCTRPLRNAPSVDEYVLADRDDVQEWEPRFTIHGFRYAQIDAETDVDVEAVVIHTDMSPAGRFDCSDPLLTRLHDNVVWSMRGNFVDLPTDCPQRDERLGWTGDIAAFAPTATYLYDCTGLLTSWLADLAAEQVRFGTVPHYVPWVPVLFDLAPAAAWGDAAVLVPWTLYQRTGDLQILADQYPSMTAWVEQIAAIAGPAHLWNTGFQFGDWLDPAAPPRRPDQARTDPYLVASAYHTHTTALLADIAALLGRPEDRRRYAELAAAARQAFTTEFVTASGRMASDAPTAYALAIMFDLLPDGLRKRAGRRLAELVADNDHFIATGFVGTPLICDALTATGHLDTAYHLLTQTGCPSWLYPVTMGATTTWERWDSMLPDGSVNPGEMTSFNHYALGAVADWMHRTVAGLAADAPGYRRLRIAPRPGGGLTHARTEHLTPHGTAAVAWHRDGGTLHVQVTAPAGTTAVVDLPGQAPTVVGSGTHTFTVAHRPADHDPVRPVNTNIHDREAAGTPA
ncbi:glycoside hydrolase family 78 protein [Catellatospora vulcania]|uniref:glycoside hydrolase family 78 protein n=1 Tax=Catellatospora vulcania TaxID=1460450 RepID=UPI0012D443B8|nr:glycoside hydrolase family 78 protein [Catellatospora vulcania]